MSGSEHTGEASDGRALTVRLCVRLTPQEKERVEGEALLGGVTLSCWVRHRLLGERVKAQAGVVVINELRRLGLLLKKISEEGTEPHSAQVKKLLGQIESLLGDLSQ